MSDAALFEMKLALELRAQVTEDNPGTGSSNTRAQLAKCKYSAKNCIYQLAPMTFHTASTSTVTDRSCAYLQLHYYADTEHVIATD